MVAAAVAHAITGDQHPRLDLAKAIEHGIHAHVGRANAPDRAQAHHRQKSHHSLGNIGQISHHPIARLHPLRTQVQGQRSHLVTQLRPAQFAVLAPLVAADDRCKSSRLRWRHMTKNLLNVIDLRAFKPPRTRHDTFAQHRPIRRGRLQVKVVPDAFPESLDLGGRPMPEVVVAIKSQAAVLRQPILVEADLGNV